MSGRGTASPRGRHPRAPADQRRRARVALDGRAAPRAARAHRRDPRHRHGGVPAARRGVGRPGRPGRQGHRGGGRARGADPGRARLRRPDRRPAPLRRDRGRRPRGHPQPDPAREGHPLAAGRAAAGRGPRDRRAARRHARAPALHRTGARPAPARRRPRRDRDRARPPARPAPRRGGDAARDAAGGAAGHPRHRAHRDLPPGGGRRPRGRRLVRRLRARPRTDRARDRRRRRPRRGGRRADGPGADRAARLRARGPRAGATWSTSSTGCSPPSARPS